MIHETQDGMTMSGAEALLRARGLASPYTLPRLNTAILAQGWSAEVILDTDGLYAAVCRPHPTEAGERQAIGRVQVRHLSIPAALTQALALALRDHGGRS